MPTRDIAKELDIGLTTVHTHLRRSRTKLGLPTAEALIAFAARYFYVPACISPTNAAPSRHSGADNVLTEARRPKVSGDESFVDESFVNPVLNDVLELTLSALRRQRPLPQAYRGARAAIAASSRRQSAPAPAPCLALG